MAKSVGKIEEILQTANLDAAYYNDDLNDFRGEISTADRKGASALIAQIVRKIIEMPPQTNQLRDQLELSSVEIRKLRGSLEMIRRKAVTEGLTDVAGRKYFDIMLSEMTDKATKVGGSVCLLLLDVNNFKAFNDSHGYQTSDQVLRLVAGTLKEGVKGHDVLARYGGEEFAIIPFGIGLEDALNVGDGIRDLVVQRRITRK
jgi:diguanylate cyclase